MDLRILEKRAYRIRIDMLKMLAGAGSGHSAGALGMADIFTALYFEILHHNPKKPNWPERDRLILSNGHICPILYTAMAHAGYFPKSELKTLRQVGTRLQGHPHRLSLPGLETTSGPLGSGLSQAVGMALAGRIDSAKWRVYALTSDGEQDTGNNWEAVMLAGKEKLSNLTALMDRNNIQIDGPTEEVMPLEPLRQKYEAFNWHVIEIDGHNMRDIIDAYSKARSVQAKPTMILAHTTPGKGVSWMENDYRWHGVPPGIFETEKSPKKEAQLEYAIKELKERLVQL